MIILLESKMLSKLIAKQDFIIYIYLSQPTAITLRDL